MNVITVDWGVGLITKDYNELLIGDKFAVKGKDGSIIVKTMIGDSDIVEFESKDWGRVFDYFMNLALSREKDE